MKIEVSLQKSQEKTISYRERKALNAIKSNSKYFFSYAKKFSQATMSKIGPLINALNEYTSSSPEMANILRKQYESVFSDATVDSSYFNTPISPNIPTIGNIKIEECDIVEAIDELSHTSSSGPDGIPAILLKMCKDSIKKPLLLLYRKLLDEGTVPASLKIAHIIPIHKGGSPRSGCQLQPNITDISLNQDPGKDYL